MDFAVPADHRVKIKESKMRQLLRLSQGTKKVMEHKGDGATNCNRCPWNSPQRVGTWMTNQDIQTTTLLRAARILRKVLERLAITQTSVKDNQLMLVWKKKHKEYNNMQKNSKCRLCSDKDETANYISECS